MNIAIGYLRVSTQEQANEGISLDAQEARIRAYCTMTGLTLAEVVREAGVSARTALSQRPGGKELLRLLRQHKATNIVVLKLDRAFRDCEDALRTCREWDEKQIVLHLVDMGGSSLTTGSAMGRLFLTLLGAFSEMEVRVCSDRTRAALAHLKASGAVYGTLPFGFARDGDRLIAIPEELEIVERMRAMYAGGISYRKIAETLNQEGICGKDGGRWHASTARYVIRNRLYDQV